MTTRRICCLLPFVVLAFQTAACSKPHPPGSAPSSSIAAASSSAPPKASASTVPSAVASAEPDRSLCPEGEIGGEFELSWLDSNGMKMCTRASGICHAIDLVSGTYRRLADVKVPTDPDPAIPRPTSMEKISATGTHLVRTTKDSVTVCKVGDPASCRLITIKGYTPHKDAKTYVSQGTLTAEVSPDGSKVLVLLYERAGYDGITFATYDVKAGKRERSARIKADEFVPELSWVKNKVFFAVCVEAGPGCNARLFDPATGKDKDLGVNVYGATPRFVRVNDHTGIMMSGEGNAASFIDMATGNIELALPLPYTGNVEMGAAGIVKGDLLYLAYGPPAYGSVAIVDMVKRVVVKKFQPPACK